MGRDRAWRLAPWAAAALVLLLPAVAMGVTDEVAWGPADFAVAAALLFGACGAWEAARRASANAAYRTAAGIALVAAVILVWINLSVGIIGAEDNPANLVFAGVLGIGLLGAVLARFRPRGMAHALAATACAQALAGVVALASEAGAAAPSGPGPALVLTTVFAALWLASAWLFRKAARAGAALL